MCASVERVIVKASYVRKFAELSTALLYVQSGRGFKRVVFEDGSLTTALLGDAPDTLVNFGVFFELRDEGGQSIRAACNCISGFQTYRYVSASDTATMDHTFESAVAPAVNCPPNLETAQTDRQDIPRPATATVLPGTNLVRFNTDGWTQYVGPRDRGAVRLPDSAAFSNLRSNTSRNNTATFNVVGTVQWIQPFAIQEDSVKLWHLGLCHDRDIGYSCWLFALPWPTRPKGYELHGLRRGDAIACFNVKGSSGGLLLTNESEIFIATNEAEGKRCVAEANE